MEDVLKIPGVLDRMLEAKIVPVVAAPAVPTVLVQTITPTQMVDVPPLPEINAPSFSSSLNSTSKKGGKWGWILLGGIAIFVFRYEIGYYVFGKPNRKYPRY